ncbi:hypothetical protein BBOR36S_00778 [Brevibacillus borstelensis]
MGNFHLQLTVVGTPIDLEDLTHGRYGILMSVLLNYRYFRPKISAACFKISFSIFNR